MSDYVALKMLPSIIIYPLIFFSETKILSPAVPAREKRAIVPKGAVAFSLKMNLLSSFGVSFKKVHNGDRTSKQAGSIGGQIWANIRANPIGSRLIIFPYSSSCFLTILMYYLQSLPRLQKKFSARQLLRILRTIHLPSYSPSKMVESYENSIKNNG